MKSPSLLLVLSIVVLSIVVLSLTSYSCFAANVDGIEFESKIITLALTQEPRSLNSLTAESVSYTAQLLAHVQEGLMRYDGRRRLTGGVAERWQINPEEMRFWLRSDARWQNGDAVTASDFVFAWRQLVNPNTGSPSANLASPIKNASKIIRGELPSLSLGVEAISDTELLIKLEHPCGWCLKLMTNSIFYPVNQAFYEKTGEKYGSSVDKHLANGAFQLKKWQRGKSIRLMKNLQYWGRDRVHLSGIYFDYIGSDAKTVLNLFRAGEIAVASLERETIAESLELGLRFRTYPSGHLFHIQFSHLPDMLSSNENIRKAINYVIDKDEIVNRVVASPGTRKADSMFHDWLTVGDQRFLDVRPPTPHQVNIEKAKLHLQKAMQELNLKGVVQLTLTINDSNLYRRIAEYLQQQLKNHLQIDLAIDPQITQIMVEKWRKGSSDMTLITWPVDVDDPMDQISFMGNPDFRSIFKGLYSGDDMAKLYLKNRDTIDQTLRVSAVEEVQKLFENKVTVLPLFEAYGASTISPKLRGFVWQPVRGYADFRYSRIVK